MGIDDYNEKVLTFLRQLKIFTTIRLGDVWGQSFRDAYIKIMEIQWNTLLPGACVVIQAPAGADLEWLQSAAKLSGWDYRAVMDEQATRPFLMFQKSD